jgi:hypothetical protein
MSSTEIDKLVEDLANMAINLGLNIEQIKDCLNKAAIKDDGKPLSREQENYNDDERKEADPNGIVLQQRDASQVLQNVNNNNVIAGNPFDLFFGKTAFGRKIMSKATESVRQLAKKKGIYVVGRKGKKFLGIRFTPKGNYSKNKKGRPNGKMYTLEGLRKMKNKRVSFKKLPQLIDMMDTGAVLKKHKDFKFGFELKKQPRGCSGFGYSFPVGAGYGRSSALLYGKL